MSPSLRPAFNSTRRSEAQVNHVFNLRIHVIQISISGEKGLEFRSRQQVGSGSSPSALEEEGFVAHQHEVEGHFDTGRKEKRVRCVELCKQWSTKSTRALNWTGEVLTCGALVERFSTVTERVANTVVVEGSMVVFRELFDVATGENVVEESR